MQIIESVNPTEYFANGNVKAFSCVLFHEGLSKSITIRHRDFHEYDARVTAAKKMLSMEWDAHENNCLFNVFYRKNEELILKSTKIDFDINNYKEVFKFKPFSITHPNINYTLLNKKYEHKLSIEEMRKLQKPNRQQDKYKVKANLLKLIILPIYLMALILKNAKYKRDLNYYLKNTKMLKDYDERKNAYDAKLEYYNNKKKEEETRVREKNIAIEKLWTGYKEKVEKDISEYFIFAVNLMKSIYHFDISYCLRYDDKDSPALIIDIDLPKDEIFPTNYDFYYVKTRGEIRSKELKQKELNSKIKNCYYNTYLSFLNLIIKIDINNCIDFIILNAYKKGIDKRTGKNYNVCLMTSKISTSEFKKLNLSNVDAKSCFKYLNGKGTPDPHNLISVKPIMFANKEEFKTIDSDDVLQYLRADTNLAAIDWREFETLIKQVFDLEFKTQNIEIRNTQHSSDGGIDVVAFNKNPYTGGVIILQAKRYVNTVNPDNVRALKGAMDEVNAIRGILVTTSDFGHTSYEYAQNHNILLINGNELLQLLRKHGYDSFHIDLEQARIINNQA